jgi:uncharacterized protein YaaR (DUF327 family)
MAKVDGADPALFLNPAPYSQVKAERQTSGDKRVRGLRRGRDFSQMFDDLRGTTGDALGPLQDLPVSEETINFLMDDVRSTGDVLKSRPLPDEIIRYKQAVRNFINYVVKNSYEIEKDEGILNKYRPSFTGRRNTPAADEKNKYVKTHVIDKKLDDLAAMLLSRQIQQLELVSRLEEIRGLLVDLLS